MFSTFVRPPPAFLPLDRSITELTGITTELLLAEGRPFPEAWARFHQWLQVLLEGAIWPLSSPLSSPSYLAPYLAPV